jgi:hypothetical protein
VEYHASRLDKKKATRWAMFGLWPLLDVSEAGDLTLDLFLQGLMDLAGAFRCGVAVQMHLAYIPPQHWL